MSVADDRLERVSNEEDGRAIELRDVVVEVNLKWRHNIWRYLSSILACNSHIIMGKVIVGGPDTMIFYFKLVFFVNLTPANNVTNSYNSYEC